MGAFTTITTDTDLQDVDLVNEIVSSYSERVQALGGVAIPDIAVGDDIQAQSFWSGLQSGIINSASNYVNHNIPLAGQDPFSWPPAMGAPWMSILPLGVRRISGPLWPSNWTNYNDPAYSYGVMQAGDIIGPWIYADLQVILQNMKWTVRQLDPFGADIVPNSIAFKQYDSVGVDVDAAYADQVINFPLVPWIQDDGYGPYYQALAIRINDTSFRGQRQRFALRVSNVPVFTSCAIDFCASGAYSERIFGIGRGGFKDVDGLGVLPDELMFIIDSTASDTNPTRDSNLIGDFNDSPCALFPVDASYQIAESRNLVVQHNTVFPFAVLKWDFTYS